MAKKTTVAKKAVIQEMAYMNCILSLCSITYMLIYLIACARWSRKALTINALYKYSIQHLDEQLLKVYGLTGFAPVVLLTMILVGLSIALMVFANSCIETGAAELSNQQIARYESICAVNSFAWLLMLVIELVRLGKSGEFLGWGGIWVVLSILNLIFLNIDRKKIRLRFGKKAARLTIVRIQPVISDETEMPAGEVVVDKTFCSPELLGREQRALISDTHPAQQDF